MNKHYFVHFTIVTGISGFDTISNPIWTWAPCHSVINRHPFEFIKEQCDINKYKGKDPHIVCAILINYKEITEEEYYTFADLFDYKIAGMPLRQYYTQQS